MEQHIGLALGGGGARGLAHLGVLLELEQAGVPISLITGTSMGAAMGATCAIGADLRKIERLLTMLDLNELLQVSDSTVRELQKIIGRSMVEYVRGSAWREDEAAPHDLARLDELFSLLTARKRFDQTLLPFAAVAADLETGERVVLNEGSLYRALTASTAVPGVFSPVAYGDRYLIDGGVVDKLPIDVAIDMGATAIIAVDTGAPLNREIANCLDALIQTQRVTSTQLTQLQIEVARGRLKNRLIVLKPDVGWIRMFDFCHTEEAIEAGKDVVRAHLDEIKEAVGLSTPDPVTGS